MNGDFDQAFEEAWQDWHAQPPAEAHAAEVPAPDEHHEPAAEALGLTGDEPVEVEGSEPMELEAAERLISFGRLHWSELTDEEQEYIEDLSVEVQELVDEHEEIAERFQEFADTVSNYGIDTDAAISLFGQFDGDTEAAATALGHAMRDQLLDGGYDLGTLAQLHERHGDLPAALTHLADVGPRTHDLEGSIGQWMRERRALR